MTRLLSDPNIAVCPDFTAAPYDVIRQALATNSTEAADIAQLTESWTKDTDRLKRLRRPVSGEKSRKQLQTQQRLLTPEEERLEAEKKKPKLGDFEVNSAPPSYIESPISPFAQRKIDLRQYCPLWPFTPAGLKEAAEARLAHNLHSLEIDGENADRFRTKWFRTPGGDHSFNIAIIEEKHIGKNQRRVLLEEEGPADRFSRSIDIRTYRAFKLVPMPMSMLIFIYRSPRPASRPTMPSGDDEPRALRASQHIEAPASPRSCGVDGYPSEYGGIGEPATDTTTAYRARRQNPATEPAPSMSAAQAFLSAPEEACRRAARSTPASSSRSYKPHPL
ncbi:hypothetical protein B0H12DRAFT_1237977 [Mycena haematopus]|nr:hypothetical protein B0H12DRAFT_1237977 [Mycena haematopus]